MRHWVQRDKLTGRVKTLAFSADDFTDERILYELDRAFQEHLVMMVVDPFNGKIIQFNVGNEEGP